MTDLRLHEQNRRFRGTGGVSHSNCSAGFLPAFCDLDTGRAERSRFAGGAPAPVHLLCGLPEDWVVARDAAGAVTAVKASVVAGFVRDGCFYTREQAAQALAH
jgi:hypothetical protein